MPTNKKGRDLSRLGLVGNAQAGAAWQNLVSSALFATSACVTSCSRR